MYWGCLVWVILEGIVPQLATENDNNNKMMQCVKGKDDGKA